MPSVPLSFASKELVCMFFAGIKVPLRSSSYSPTGLPTLLFGLKLNRWLPLRPWAALVFILLIVSCRLATCGFPCALLR